MSSSGPDLPDASTLVLSPMTHEQWQRSQDLQCETWGNGVPLDQFRDREERLLIKSDFAKRD